MKSSRDSWIIGILWNYNGNGNVEKAISLMNKTRTLPVHHAFFVHFFAVLHIYNVTWPNFEMTWERERQGDKFYFLYLKSDTVPLFNSNGTFVLSSNWVTCYKGEKVVKDAKSIFRRRFHWHRRCRIVTSLLSGPQRLVTFCFNCDAYSIKYEPAKPFNQPTQKIK